MPKIRIRERDLTTNEVAEESEQYILYVLNEDEQEIAETLDTPITAETAPRAITATEAAKLEGDEPTDEFLELAIKYGGRLIVAHDWNIAEEYCGDRNQYDIKFILADSDSTHELDGGNTRLDLRSALIIAQKRKDCVVVLQSSATDPADIETTGTENEAITVESLLTTRCSYIDPDAEGEEVTDEGFFSTEVKTPAGKYVIALYAPGGIHDADDTALTLEANEAYVLAYLNSIASGYAEWQAVAGATRGAIPGDYEVDGFLKEDDIDTMQPRLYTEGKQTIAVNPICNVNPWGTRIWGNRTCLPNTSVVDKEGDPVEGTDQLVASSFANIRILICDIKKELYRAARTYQFEQESDVLWVNFTSSVNTLLEEMKSSYGITGYRWTRETATERAKLKATLKLQVVEALEDIDLEVQLADSLEVAE